MFPGHKNPTDKHMIDNSLLANSDAAKRIDSPSHAIAASARGLAKLASAMANKGKFGDG